MIIKDPTFEGRSIRVTMNGTFIVMHEISNKELDKVNSLNDALRKIVQWKIAKTEASLTLADYRAYEEAIFMEMQQALEGKQVVVPQGTVENVKSENEGELSEAVGTEEKENDRTTSVVTK